MSEQKPLTMDAVTESVWRSYTTLLEERWIKELDAERAAHAETREQLAQARKDTERLDWREAHPKHGFGLHSDGTWADGKGGSHATYREAIDAAMGSLREGGTK